MSGNIWALAVDLDHAHAQQLALCPSPLAVLQQAQHGAPRQQQVRLTLCYKLRLVALCPPLGICGIEADACADLVVRSFKRLYGWGPVLVLLLAAHSAQKEVTWRTVEEGHDEAPFGGRTGAILPYTIAHSPLHASPARSPALPPARRRSGPGPSATTRVPPVRRRRRASPA